MPRRPKSDSSRQGEGLTASKRSALPAPLPEWWTLIPGYDPAAGRAVANGCWFDLKAANRAIDFFAECLTFTAGQWMGNAFVLQTWQQAIVGHLFGWKRTDGTRRYREAFIYVPRKCGKSELAGGLGNYLAFADCEPGAQVYCAASDREQAKPERPGADNRAAGISQRVSPHFRRFASGARQMKRLQGEDREHARH